MKQIAQLYKLLIVVTIGVTVFSSSSQAQTDLLPDIYVAPNYLYDNDISTTTLPGRKVLRLSNGTANIGAGKLHLYGVLPGNTDGTQNVNQRVYRSNGTFYDRSAGRFIYHPTHNHIHVENWSIFRLRSVLPGDGVGSVVAQGAKTSFCIIDLQIYNSSLPNYNPAGQFTSCASTTQGLSVGWVDIYNKYLDGQYIDVTGIPDGVYWLEAEVDPSNHILESNETNNISRIKVTIGTPAAINADVYEPNNSLTIVNGRTEGAINSPNLGPCAPLKRIDNLTIQGSTDPDFFKFYLNATGTASDYVKIFFTHSLGDVDIELQSANGVRLTRSEGVVNNETISLNGRAKGWYVLRIYGYNGATHPDYDLEINPSSNGAPSITTTAPPVGNVNVLHAVENYAVRWNFSDPENDNAWVTVYVNSTPSLNGSQTLLSTSINTPASAGLYNINTAELPLGQYYVYCQINDGGTVTGSWAPGTITLVDNLILGSIAGTVTDQTSASLAGATVQLLGTGRSVLTDSVGHYRFDTLISGTYALGFMMSGMVDTIVDEVVVSAPDSTIRNVQMRPVPPPVAAVGGTIVDSTGQPIQGATISMLSPAQQTTADQNGGYTFPNLLAGSYSLTFSATGFFDTTISSIAHTPPTPTTANLTMRKILLPTASILGFVFNDAGDSLAGVTVTIDNPNGSTSTDSSGRFSFDGRVAGSYTVSFQRAGYVDTSITAINHVPPTETVLSIVMRTAPPPVANIAGTVTGFGGVALAGATVTMTSPSQGTTTDSVGGFLFSNFLSGTYELTLQASGYFDTTISNISHNAPTATNLTIAMRRIPPPTASILGFVFNDAGDSIAGVSVSIDSPSGSTSTDSSGRFSFDGRVAGSYTINFQLAGYVDTSITGINHVPPTETVLSMVMRTAPPPVANIAGTVTGFGDVALAGATVTMTSPSQGTTTDSVGGFLFSNFLSGTYELTLQAAGYFDTTISNISHNAPTETNLTIAMRQIPPPMASILGLVTDSAGNPLEGVGISLVSPSLATTSLADGTFEFAGLLSGTYQFVMVLSGYADTTIESIVIDAPTNTNVIVAMRKLPPVGSISGVVTDQAATPLANVTVEIQSLSLTTTTNGAGQYAFDDLLSGVYDLKYTAVGYYDSTVTSVVHTAPTSSTVSLSLRAVPPPVGTIRGTVRNTSGAEMVGVSVQLVSPARSTTTDVTGQFAFAELFSGLYSVRFAASGYVDTTVSGITLSAPYDFSKVVIMRPASLVPVADAYEPNNSLTEVAGKVFGGHRSPNLGPVGPLTVINSLSIHSTTSDYYRFTTNATGTSADFVRLNFLHSLGDIDVDLLTTTNTQIGRSAGSVNSEQISLNNLAKGTYVIRVYGYNGAKNPNYSLTLDVPSNQAPTIAATLPAAGNVNLLQGANGRVGWTFSDPESDPCYVSLYLNSSPTLDGNQLPMTSVQNSSASVGELIFSTASVPVGTYYAYLEITDGGQKSGSWAPGTFTITNSGATATLAGVVTNQLSAAIRGASVTLINPAMSATTDSLGQFSFAGLLSGVYTARIKAMDYFDTTVTNLVITAPTTTNALVAMTALPRETDNFADADFSNWTAVNTGVWSAVAGGLKGNGDNLDAVLRSPFAQYGACELTANMKMSIFLDRRARLIFSYIDANNYRFIEGDESNDRWRIGERVNGVNTIQASVITPIANDTWYSVRASVASTGLVTLRVNNNVITSWKFATVVNGRIGVGYSRGNVDFDDVTVIGIPTAPAPEGGGPDVNDNGIASADDGLLQNYPNPFNPVTQISFSIASTQRVRLTVFNILGEVVRELVNEEIGAGVHSIEWDGTSANGHSVASGVYFYQLITEKATQSKKMMLVK